MPASKSEKDRRGSMPRIELHEFKVEDEHPEIAVYALGEAGKVLASARVDEQGNFKLPEKAAREARIIALGPVAEEFSDLERDVIRRYRADEFLNSEVITVVKPDWGLWYSIKRCISGDVRRCRLHPFYVKELNRFALSDRILDLDLHLASPAASRNSLRSLYGDPLDFLWPKKCSTICDGKVEVYERLCCQQPWIIDDLHLAKLKEVLQGFIEAPPVPPPGPGPRLDTPFVRDGALDIGAVNARRDLAALKLLDRAQQLEYIEARPYLWHYWKCGEGKKVGEGNINPDGSFTVCWSEPPIIIDFCYRQYAFVITQIINGSPVVIYDGRAANQWFNAGDDILLTSYHKYARACRPDPFPLPGAYVMLEHIGDTDSWQLQTPDANSARSVVAPLAFDAGLANTTSNTQYTGAGPRDRNWGGRLDLQYIFTEEMYSLGARYYRISYQRAGTDGRPTGALKYFSETHGWTKWSAGNNVTVPLGPDPALGDNRYKIPFDAILGGGEFWEADQYHGWIRTEDESDGRYLVTVEVFDGAGNRLRPASSPAGDEFLPTPNSAAFTFRRWFAKTDVTPNTKAVNHSALTHLIWWDNKDAVGKIVYLRHNGAESGDDCQFLCDEDEAGNDTFGVSYRAYFPGNALFLNSHSLHWYRGLDPAPHPLAIDPNPGNIGEEPPIGSLPGQSGTELFSTMLDGRARCSFSVRLIVTPKTFNGYHLVNNNADVTAAFALQAGNCGPCECEENEE